MLYHASCNGYSMPIIDNFKSICAHEDNVIASALGYIMHSPLACALCNLMHYHIIRVCLIKDTKLARLVIAKCFIVGHMSWV